MMVSQFNVLFLSTGNSARSIFAEKLREIGRLSGEERGRLVIAASTTIAQYLLPRLLVHFLRQCPKAQVSVSSGNTEEVVSQVEERKVILGLIEGPARTNDLKVEDFIEDEIVVIAPAGHPWTRGLASV